MPAFKPLKPLKRSAAASTKASGRQPLLPPSSWLRSSIAACPLPAHSPFLLGHSSLPFASLQTLKTPKTLRGSFHQALWPSAFAAPGLQPALCLHIPPRPLAVSLCCSRVAACPLPAHSPLLLGHSSLPFASLQTLKTPKTLRGSFHQALWPSAFASTKLLAVSAPALQPALYTCT